MLENNKLFSFDNENSAKFKEDLDDDSGNLYDETPESTGENPSTFPSILIPQTIVTLLCLILILLISGSKEISWAKWVRHKIHDAVNASTESTFGYITHLSAYKSLMHNVENMIKLENITQKISSGKLFLSQGNVFQISVWPVQGDIIKDYGWKENPQTHAYEFNPGLLFGTSPADEVVADGDGNVTKITNQPGPGCILVIDHGSGWSSVYHNLSKVKVNIGQAVQAGETIAWALSKELLFEVKYNDEPVDPTTMLYNQINNDTI